ncbi:hypothetical protein [Cryptosporangium sp. NPDC051539]|uniref:hypothetical protein n=1 Tax=Cryptosporangium sp. NPDC051539 TaxID=3363962 RepID=UPI0037BA9B5A
MGRRFGAVLLTGVILTVAACSGNSSPQPAPSSAASPPASPSASGSPTPRLSPVPALRLPTVAKGAPCPMTAEHALRSSLTNDDGVGVLGRGPVAPVAYYFTGKGATLELRPDDKNPDGTYGKKVRWIGAGYAGPVLIRAARIDGTGTAFARLSEWAEKVDGGYSIVLTEKDNDMPATTTVSGPGCFAYQVDGTNFRDVIVFRAVTAG